MARELLELEDTFANTPSKNIFRAFWMVIYKSKFSD